jgi:hydrogenase maturation factor
MCLTIPKKVLEIKKDCVIVETFNHDRQILKTLIDLNIGDFVLSQQNVIIEKLNPEEALDLLDIIREK